MPPLDQISAPTIGLWFRFVGTIRYAIAYLDAIIVVLTMMRNGKMVVPDDQWISMARVEFEITSDDGGEFGCDEDCCNTPAFSN